jgi:hypothetical protein
MNCEQDISKMINNYMQKGWNSISKYYLNKPNLANNNLAKANLAKEKNIDFINDKLLKLLGALRIYYVDLIFKCFNKNKNCEYLSFGSTELTSDYDITIIGKDSPDLTWKMFKFFLYKYGNSLPYVFDVNLYCNGYLSNKGLKITKYVTKIDEQISVIRPQTSYDYKICLNYALLKIFPSETGFCKTKIINYKVLENYLKFPKKLKKELDKELKEKKISGLTKFNKKVIDETKKYYLASSYCKKAFDFLYGNKNNSDTLIENLCRSCYYSIESYFTHCTINVVVIEMQGKKEIKLDKKDYIISAIENLGDFLLHTKEYSKIVLLKTSKYLYRIYYSLYKATQNENYQNENYQNKMNFIKDEIIPLRGKKIESYTNQVNTFLEKDNIKKDINSIINELDKLISENF